MPQLLAKVSREDHDALGEALRAEIELRMREIGRNELGLPIEDIWFHWDPFDEGSQKSTICIWIEQSLATLEEALLKMELLIGFRDALVRFMDRHPRLPKGFYSAWIRPIFDGDFKSIYKE